MRPLLQTICFLCLSLSHLLAGDASVQPWPLPPAEFFLKQIPAPPQAGDALDKADLDFTVALQAGATPTEIAHAIQSAGFTVFTFSEVLGPEFTAAKYPRTAAFFTRLEVTANDVKNELKDHFKRLRPIDAHKDVVKENVPYEAGYSFPSGHSTRSWLYALVLGQLDPADRLALLRSAAQVGLDRVIGGMHYQSDVVNSRAASELIFECLMKEPDFVKDLDALKAAEWTPPPSAPAATPAQGAP